MGRAERINVAAGLPRVLATRLEGLRVVVDVQHLHRDGRHAGDRGAVFVLANKTKVTEAAAATMYAGALVSWLQERGATVLTNSPTRGILTGPYSRRNAAANVFQASCYLACHVNAGGGSYFAGEYMVGTNAQPLADTVGQLVLERFPMVQAKKAVPLVQGQRGAVCIQGVDRSRPAVILEPFFGDNPRHWPMLAGPQLKALGEAIGAGVALWWDSTKPKK